MIINQEITVLGFVIKSSAYKESDALLQVYTKEYGRMTLLAKGIKKIKSKNAAGCQTLTLSEFTFIPRKGISTLIKASPVTFYRHIKEDIELEAYASYFSEFIYKFTEENDPDEEVYTQFLQAITCLENGYRCQIVYLLFNALILKLTGTPLIVDGCSYCGSTSNIVAISYSNGGFVCANCKGQYDRIFDKAFLKAFRHINKFTLLEIDEVKIEEKYIVELVSIMEYYIDEYTGILFKTKKFIKQFQN